MHDWMQDDDVVAGLDPVVQDALSDTADVTGLIDDFLSGDLTAPAVGPLPPPVDLGLPELSLPGPSLPPPLFHPDEFALNGFPFQGNDPTEPGYWNPPSF